LPVFPGMLAQPNRQMVDTKSKQANRTSDLISPP